MTYEEIQLKQKELEKEEFECPTCGETEIWYVYIRYGCEKAFVKHYKKERIENNKKFE